MDDRNIVRAVLFSAAVKIALDTHQKFGKVPGTFITKDEYEKHIMDDAGSMVDDMVDAADIHDEDCDCDEEESEDEQEVKLSELSLENLNTLLEAVKKGAAKVEIGGECRACGERLKGRAENAGARSNMRGD